MVRNLRGDPRARIAIGTTSDVVLIDGVVTLVPVHQVDSATAEAIARVSHDPRVMPGLICLRVEPRRILVWNGFHEFEGRTVMAEGQWLD